MGYYIRILSLSEEMIPLRTLKAAVSKQFKKAMLSLESGSEDEWKQVAINHSQPASAANWLKDYFSKVRTIYAFQLFSGTEEENGWEILGSLKEAIWNSVRGIFQADAEGFSNEDGYHTWLSSVLSKTKAGEY